MSCFYLKQPEMKCQRRQGLARLCEWSCTRGRHVVGTNLFGLNCVCVSLWTSTYKHTRLSQSAHEQHWLQQTNICSDFRLKNTCWKFGWLRRQINDFLQWDYQSDLNCRFIIWPSRKKQTISCLSSPLSPSTQLPSHQWLLGLKVKLKSSWSSESLRRKHHKSAVEIKFTIIIIFTLVL